MQRNASYAILARLVTGGEVLTIILPFADDEEAIHLANISPYRLAASVCTGSLADVIGPPRACV